MAESESASASNAVTYQVVPDAEALAQAAAEQFVRIAKDAQQKRGRFFVALAGGSTPQRMHELLRQDAFREQVDWSNVIVFFGDERFLPAEHPDNNYHMAKNTLLDHVPIPEKNVHAFQTSSKSPQDAASAYEQTLRSVFGTTLPVFDLILLGIGPDGHTASLFPGFAQVTHPTGQLVAVVTDSPKPPADRLTLTYKTLNAARHILFLAGGASKADIIPRIFAGDSALPAARVKAHDGEVMWLLDEAAASKL